MKNDVINHKIKNIYNPLFFMIILALMILTKF